MVGAIRSSIVTIGERERERERERLICEVRVESINPTCE